MPFCSHIITNTLRRTLRITIFLPPCVIVPHLSRAKLFFSCSPRVSYRLFFVFLGEAMWELKSLLIFSYFRWRRQNTRETFFFFLRFEVEFFGWKSRAQARSISREGNDKSFQGELHTMQGKVSNLMKVFEMMDGAELKWERSLRLDFSIFVTNEVTWLQFVVIERGSDAKMHRNNTVASTAIWSLRSAWFSLFSSSAFPWMDAKMYK